MPVTHQIREDINTDNTAKITSTHTLMMTNFFRIILHYTFKKI